MLVKGIFTNISGSVGGLTGSHNKGGQYMRARTTPTNPNTAAQQRARTDFTAAGNGWSGITPEQREAWNQFAQQQVWKNRLGDAIQLSGQQAYVASFSALRSAGLTPVDLPPAPNTRPPGLVWPGVILFGIDGGAANISNIPAYGGDAADRIVISVGRPIAPGATFYKGPFTIGNVAGANLAETPLNEAFATAINNLITPQEDMRLPLRVRVVNATGQYSEFADAITAPAQTV